MTLLRLVVAELKFPKKHNFEILRKKSLEKHILGIKINLTSDSFQTRKYLFKAKMHVLVFISCFFLHKKLENLDLKPGFPYTIHFLMVIVK